ncbi:MAG: sulfurtransferase TusA family protein, partial [Candidatus Acidiferrales bacterium]
MPDSTPKWRLDLEDLALHEGATVLLRSALSHLAAGEWCEVRGDSPGFTSQLAAWCRKEGLPCLSVQAAAGTYRIES